MMETAAPAIEQAWDRIRRMGTDQTRPAGGVRAVIETGEGREAIRYEKRVNGTTYIVEEARMGREDLALKTMYKKRADGAGASDTDPEGQPRSGTSETPPARPSTEESSTETSKGKGDRAGAPPPRKESKGRGRGLLNNPRPCRSGARN